MAQVIVGVFPDRLTAERAIIDLKEAGFDPTHIGFMTRSPHEAERVANDVGVDVGAGAVTGGLLGGALGAILAATGTLIIPGVGPFIAAGILLSALAGGAAGAIVGGLVGLGIPHEEAEYYNRRVLEGATLVTVDAPGKEAEARQIFLRNGAEDTWGTTPWQSPAERYNTQAGVNAESPRAETMMPEAEPWHPTEPIADQPAPTAVYGTTQQVYDANHLPQQLSPSAEAAALDASQGPSPAPRLEAQPGTRPGTRPGMRPNARPVDRGSVVGPGDAVQHAGATNPFAGELQPNQPDEGTMNYDEPGLGQPEPPLAPNALPPERT